MKKSSYNPQIHHRRSIRLPNYDYSQPGYYFITICTKNRDCLLGVTKNNKIELSPIGEIAKQCWLDIPKHYPHTRLDEYIIMPNHVHGIILAEFNNVAGAHVGAIHELPLRVPLPHTKIFRRRMLIPKIIGRFKMNSAKIINQLCNTQGIPFWQRNYYEHIIRNKESLYRIRQYIKNNPKNWINDSNNPDNKKSTK
ncbi:transposase [Patescibacteria group bacterium]|nr:transposase [Patescibacteria group bacterium]